MIKYIGVDYHGPKDFHKDFSEIERSGITLYFYHTNKLGTTYCQRHCEHCSMRVLPEYNIPLKLAGNISQSLYEKGYNVILFPTDSYSYDVIKHRLSIPRLVTASWTSGTTLLRSDWYDSLSFGYKELGYRSITLCGYGVGDTPVPFRGVITAREIEEVIKRINYWNEGNKSPMIVNLTLTIHRENYTIENLEKMVEASMRMKVNKIRFNCFVNYRDDYKFRDLALTREQVGQFYGHLATLFKVYEESDLEFEVSENFGDEGIGQIRELMDPLYHHEDIGVCRAGWRLFAIIKIDNEIVVVGCVDRLGPVLGHIKEESRGSWRIEWNIKRIHKIRDWRDQLYGCWGGIGVNEGFNQRNISF